MADYIDVTISGVPDGQSRTYVTHTYKVPSTHTFGQFVRNVRGSITNLQPGKALFFLLKDNGNAPAFHQLIGHLASDGQMAVICMEENTFG